MEYFWSTTAIRSQSPYKPNYSLDLNISHICSKNGKKVQIWFKLNGEAKASHPHPTFHCFDTTALFSFIVTIFFKIEIKLSTSRLIVFQIHNSWSEYLKPYYFLHWRQMVKFTYLLLREWDIQTLSTIPGHATDIPNVDLMGVSHNPIRQILHQFVAEFHFLSKCQVVAAKHHGFHQLTEFNLDLDGMDSRIQMPDIPTENTVKWWKSKHLETIDLTNFSP